MSEASKPVVRLARLEEFDEIAKLARKSFLQDPVLNYFRCAKKMLDRDIEGPESQGLEVFFGFLLRACHATGGRITVAVKTAQKDSSGRPEENIVAAAFWCPPGKRITPWKVTTLVRCGVIAVLRRWGLTALMRVGSEYPASSHAALRTGYKLNEAEEKPGASWYLQLLMTDPAFEDQGLMSLLIREAYVNVLPSSTFTLEATTAKIRDRYAHLGFELLGIIKLGPGKVDASDVPADGKEATGVECYSMVNWGHSRETQARS